MLLLPSQPLEDAALPFPHQEMTTSQRWIPVDPSRGLKRMADGSEKPSASSNTSQGPSTPAQSRRSDVDYAKLDRLLAAVGIRNPGEMFNVAEDELLVFLKEETELTWQQIHKYFPHRKTWHSLQGRYSHKLNKNRQPRTRHSSSDTSSESAVPVAPSRERRTRQQEPKDYYIPPPEAAMDEPHIHQSTPEIATRPASRQQFQVLPKFASQNSNRPLKIPARQRARHKTLELRRLRDGFAIASMTQKIMLPLRSSGVNTYKSTSTSPTISKPYLAKPEREFVNAHGLSITNATAIDIDAGGWHDAPLHVDFTMAETTLLKASVRAVISGPIQSASSKELEQIAAKAVTRGPFINRSYASIFSFLQDMARGEANRERQMHRLATKATGTGLDKLLYYRALGSSPRACKKALHTKAEESLSPCRIFNGMSSDVNTLAWSPDSIHFAVGSAALTDEHSMQYNRAVNLVTGSADSGLLNELPQHIVPRVAPERGANATSSMQNSQDPFLYTTISALDFSKDGNFMFSAGYDQSVRLWSVDRDGGRPTLRYRVDATSPVDALALGPGGNFAIASQTLKNSIKLYTYEHSGNNITQCRKSARFMSEHAMREKDLNIYPSCLRWAPHPQYQQYLLAGFAAKDDTERRGETCLWDVVKGPESVKSLNRRAVFDIAWSLSRPSYFAVGCTPSTSVNRGIRSVVRVHDLRNVQSRCFELECPALDMNDVVFNNAHGDLVSAGCTDGKVYLWDLRSPHQVLHTFEHGQPLAELDDSRSRDVVDTGVRFHSWNQTERLLYSGSSDGIISVWDPYLSGHDSHQYNLVQMDSGIMEARFSPDFSDLLVGDIQGSIMLLSTFGANQDTLELEPEPFKFSKATSTEIAESAKRININLEMGELPVASGQDMVRAGQISILPFGDFPRKQAVQGPCYHGPYDPAVDAEQHRERARAFQQQALEVVAHNLDSPRADAGFADEVYDEGHWRTRIPHNISGDNATATATATEPAATSRCCFRCGLESELRNIYAAGSETSTGRELLCCTACGNMWRPDVLGYQLVERDPGRGQRQIAAPPPQQSTDEFQEVVDNLSEYHDLWEIDRAILQLGI